MMEKIKTCAETEKNTVKNRLFQYLDLVLDVSQKKFVKKRAKNLHRLKWGRLIVQTVSSYGKLLELTELENLQKRIEVLEGFATSLNLEVQG